MLFDLGHVSTVEPFQKLVNQGMVVAAAYTDERGMYVEASEVVEQDGKFLFDGVPVHRELGKMGKSLKNAVTPDDVFRDYGADTLRLYEMATGPLDASRPWNTSDIIGVHRFLQRLWRNVIDEDTGVARVSDATPDEETKRVLHRTIAAVRADMESMGFNTAIARLTECNNHLTQVVARDGAAPPRGRASTRVDGGAARAAHRRRAVVAARSRRHTHLRAVPGCRSRVPRRRHGRGTGADQRQGAGLASPCPREPTPTSTSGSRRADPRIAALLEGKEIRKVIIVPGRTVNFVVG